MTHELRLVSGRKLQIEEIGKIISGAVAAKAFKYYTQFSSDTIRIPIHYQHIGANGFYVRNKQTFDTLVSIFSKYKLDVGKYIKHTVLANKLRFADSKKLLDINIIREYANDVQVQTQRKHIYDRLLSTARFIAQYCVDNGILNVADCFKDMIRKRTLATYYMTGKISKHYLSAIHNFPAIVDKLDAISKGELAPIAAQYEKLNNDTLDAMVQEHGFVFKVLTLTNEMIDDLYSRSVSSSCVVTTMLS